MNVEAAAMNVEAAAVDAEAFAILYATICRVFPPGPNVLEVATAPIGRVCAHI
jgi:hypothetical protein